jgi:Domain of unknown function (DUF6777)/TIR domain
MTTDGPGVFISYRRKEASSHADRLHDRLAARLGEDRVFMDVDSIKPGENWIEAISNALAKCGLMLVLIGDQWGQARIDRDAPTGDTDDYVRLEIDAAFDRGIPIIPVLLEETVMPRHADLPDTLVKLSNLQAIRVRHDTFRSDAASLLKVVEDVLDAYEDEGNSSRAHSVVNNILAPPHDKTDASLTGADQGLRDGEIGAGQGGRSAAGAGTAAMRPEPVEGRGRSENPLREPGSRPRLSLASRVLIPLLTLVSLVAVGFGIWIFTSTTRTEPAAGEEIAEAVGTVVNPFLEGVGQDVTQPPPPNAAGPVRGDTAGLYGGTRRGTSCDAAKLVAFLQTHPDKGSAWAGVLKLSLQQIPPFVAQLTPLILRADTRVTNHGFKDGHVTSFPSILQAGTAVLVDRQGVPVVKCFCGNPLTSPRSDLPHTYQGKAWPGFDARKVVVIKPAPVAVKSFKAVDHTTGKLFSKKTGVRVASPNSEQPNQAGSVSPNEKTPQSASLSPSATADTASPTPSDSSSAADTASPTPSVTPGTADPTMESQSSPTESGTADQATGGESQGGSGSGQAEGNGSGGTQTESYTEGGTAGQGDTGTDGGAGTNPDTGGGTNGSPGS